MIIKFKRISQAAKIPSYAHAGDSGMDVYAAENISIPPHGFAKIRTGIAAEIPTWHELQVRPRSGMQCVNGIVGAWGTVDEGYRGEIGVALYNHTDSVYDVYHGDRIAQLVLAPVVRAEIEEVADIAADTERSTGGFGSTVMWTKMSDKNQETIADIVREMRTLGRLDEKSTDKIPRSLQALGLRTYADRIESAHQREVAELKLQRKEALAIASDIDKCASIERHIDAMLKKNEVIVGLRKEITELRECLEQAYVDKIGTYTMKGNEVDRWRKDLGEKGEPK